MAWVVESNTSLDIGGLGHATLWDNNAAAKGLVVRPAGEAAQVGDIAHWEGNDSNPTLDYGHVGIVVSTSPLQVAEYNGGRDGNYRIRPDNSGIDHYIRVPGLSGGGGGGGSTLSGTDTIGVYNPTPATFDLRNSNTPGNADVSVQYGNLGAKPLVGDWDGL